MASLMLAVIIAVALYCIIVRLAETEAAAQGKPIVFMVSNVT